MDNLKFCITGARSEAVPLAALDRLLSEADGALCLLYLYILRAGGALDAGSAARTLRMTDAEVRKAAQRLADLELIAPLRKTLPSAPELPEYDALEVAGRGGQDPGFRAILEETQRIFGRMLGTSELKQLFGVYDHLKLPPEVMLMLINQCVSDYREKFGEGRLPSLRSIEKEGFLWADLEILTLEQAEAHVRRRKQANSDLGRLRRALGLQGRELSATEKKYAESWLALGFLVESLELAYDRTVLKTGALKWGYMNSIIQSWHEKGLHTPEEIAQGDRPAGSARGRQRQAEKDAESGDDAQAEQTRLELERSMKILEKIRNGG
ncbi:MAG: DnaD domain protein [Firmicutes bacterium]|nr:DnaD domain protein [Bacillota bacterium]